MKTLLLALSVHAPSVMVVKDAQVSSVAETVVAATLVAALVANAAVTCAMFTVGCGQKEQFWRVQAEQRKLSVRSVPKPPLANKTRPNS